MCYERFEAYHWHVQRVMDGNDLDAIEAAIEAAKAETGKPSLIAVRTVIGYGSPKAGTNKVHGEAMGAGGRGGDEEVLWIPRRPELLCCLKTRWRTGARRWSAARSLRLSGRSFSQAIRRRFPSWRRSLSGRRRASCKAGWEKAIPSFAGGSRVATRNAGGTVMNAIADEVPELFGGAADLTASTQDNLQAGRELSRRSGGRATSSSACASSACARR